MGKCFSKLCVYGKDTASFLQACVHSRRWEKRMRAGRAMKIAVFVGVVGWGSLPGRQNDSLIFFPALLPERIIQFPENCSQSEA